MTDTAAAPAADPGATATPAADPAVQAPAVDPAAQAPAANPAAAPADPAGASWYEGFQGELKGYAENKGWKDPAAAVESYRNLEKLLGVPQDRVLKLPKHDAPAEEWNAVWERLGRPGGPEGYGFKSGEGDTSGFSEWAGKTFHELGMPKAMAEQLMEKFGEFSKGINEKQNETRQAAVETEVNALKSEWGAAHEQNTATARQAAKALGVDDQTIDGLESSMGFAKVMKLFHTIGSKMGEGEFVGGGAPAGFGVMTPAAAQTKIKALRSDPEFAAKYAKGDAAARSEMEKLHKWAYPE